MRDDDLGVYSNQKTQEKNMESTVDRDQKVECDDHGCSVKKSDNSQVIFSTKNEMDTIVESVGAIDYLVITESDTLLPKSAATIVSEETFTLLGHQDSIDPNGLPITDNLELTYAKQTTNSNGNSYFYIREDISGNPYNPISPDKPTRADRLVQEVKFKKVSKGTFDDYTQFLKTKNLAHYKNVGSKFF